MHMVLLAAALAVGVFGSDSIIGRLAGDARRIGLFALGSAAGAVAALACVPHTHGRVSGVVGFIGLACAGMAGSGLSQWQRAKARSRRAEAGPSSRAA